MNQGWTYRDRIHSQDSGLTVLQFYAQRYRHSSRAEWQERILAGQIRLDGALVQPETRLQQGQQLTYERSPWEEPTVPLDFAVLYADPDLLVVAKPAGLPVLPGGGFLEHTLLWQLQQRYPQETPLPVHRLGRGTSGLMLLGRSPLARAQLSQQLRAATQDPYATKTITKTYRALVGCSQPASLPDQFSITHPIGKIPHAALGYVYGATADGLPAHSDVQVVRRDEASTLLEVTIRTGRPHQIRIHLAAVGFPLLGDPLYVEGGVPRQPIAATQTLPVPSDMGYHLHAYHLALTHPRTGAALHFTCPPPAVLA